MSKVKKNAEPSNIEMEGERDVTNLQLRNYFQNRIESREPRLILKQKEGNFKSYSRVCQSSQSRQPVIVTAEQMKKIREEYDEYNDPKNYIEYGTDPNNKYTYICPKYWNMKTNKPISEVDMAEKKLQKYIIPRNAKKIPANAYIYEFTNEKGEHYEYPNFIPDHHPDGFCLPCCFKDYDTKKRVEVKNQCMQGIKKPAEKEKAPKTRKAKEPKAKPTKSATKTKKKGKEESESESESEEEEELESEFEFELDAEEEKEEKKEPEREKVLDKGESRETMVEYIKGPDKFPLEQGRWGFLPVGLQKLLEHDNTKCQISSTNTNLKINHPCLLRHGIKYNPNQSFLECVADVLDISLDKLKIDLEEYLSLDIFLMMQNGNLSTDFFNDPKHKVSADRMALCKTSELYLKKINKQEKEHIETFNRSCISYDLFMKYLIDPTSVIDHTYMWDIVSSALKVSLCVFEIPDDDITDNVEILCPTNHYTRNLLASPYDDIVVIVKKQELYEPIYLYTKNERGPPTVKRMFSKKDPTIDSIKKVLKRIEEFMQKRCTPVNLYNMKPPIHIKTALNIFKSPNPNYAIISQVVNYNSRVIGLFVEARVKTDYSESKSTSKTKGKNASTSKSKSKKEYEIIHCVVPVQPTGLLDKLHHTDTFHRYYRQIHMATDPDILATYEDTLKFYHNLCKNTKGQIPCKLVLKVVEDEMVVGFITETNQFVMIDPPVPLQETEEDGIDVLDEIIAPRPEVDKEIVDAMSETNNEHSAERNRYVARLKQDSEQFIIFRNTLKLLLKKNGDIRGILRELVREPMDTPTKIENIISVLKEISSDKIHFVDQERLPVSLDLLNIRDEDPIVLRGRENEQIYYYKIADGLIRNTRMREYMLSLNPVVVEKDDYEVNADEIILNESMILEYYDNLKPTVTKPNKYTSYDETQPGIYKQFENVDDYNFYEDQTSETRDCATNTTTSQLSGVLATMFSPQENKMVRFKCSYGLIQSIIAEKTSLDQLRLSLIEEYRKYSGYSKAIHHILKKQGKKKLIEEMLTKHLTIEDLVLSTNYYLTTLDLWLLCNRYKVPCILISNRKDKRSNLIETMYTHKSFLLYGTPQDKIAFIVVPGTRLKKDSLRLMQQTNKGKLYDSYFYAESDLTDSSLVSEAFEHSYPIEVLLQRYQDRMGKKEIGEDGSSSDDEGDAEDSSDEEEEP